MIGAAANALTQLFSPPLRPVLWKVLGLALILVALLGIGTYHVLAWLLEYGRSWAESASGAAIHTPLNVVAWMLSVAAGLGIVVGGVLLMPAVTALTASFFVDEIADVVEREGYPADPPGTALPIWRATLEGVKTALLAVAVYLCAAPFLLVAGAGLIIFFLATAYLLGREYFELAAMRFRSPEDAKALRKRNARTVFTAGLFIAAFVSIPFVNLATPIFGMAFMVHMHKRIADAERRAR